MILKNKYIFNNILINKNDFIIEQNFNLIEKKIKNKELKKIKNINIINFEEVQKTSSFLLFKKNINNKFFNFNLNDKKRILKFKNNIYLKNNILKIEKENKIFLKKFIKIELENIKTNLFFLKNKNEFDKTNFLFILNSNNNNEYKKEFNIIFKKPKIKTLFEKKFNNEIDLEIKNLNVNILNNKIIINFDKLNHFNNYDIYYFENDNFNYLTTVEYKKNIIIDTDKKIISIIPKGVY